MRRKNLDERITESQSKVNSTACGILLWGILIILLYRQLYLGQEFKDYADIFMVWLVACAYVAFGSVLRGIKPFDGKRLGLLVVPAIMALTILGVNLYRGAIESPADALLTVVVAFACGFVTFYALYLLYIWWEKKNLGEE